MGDIDRHLLVFGKLTFPKGAATTWQAASLRGDEWGDWPDLLEGGHLGPTTVAAAIDALGAMNRDQGDIAIGIKGLVVTVFGYLLEPGTRAWARDVAAPFRAAAGPGGRGDITFLQVNGEGGARFAIDPTGSQVEELAPDDALELLGASGANEALRRYTQATNPAPVPVSAPTVFDELRDELAVVRRSARPGWSRCSALASMRC